MRLHLPLALFAAAAFACAHQAASNLSARVLAAQPGSPSAAAPLPGAQVLMSCPDGMRTDLGESDSDGIVNLSPSVAPALDCKLTVARAGFKSDTFAVGDACVERAANVCTAMRVTRVLEPSGSAGY